MITFTLSIGSLIVGCIFGLAISFFSCWAVEKLINKENEPHVDFSHGWECGYKYGKEFTEKHDR